MAVSVEARPAPTKATAVSDNRATRSTGPGRSARGQQRHHRLPNFARNLSWSFFDTPQKRCNSNDANSMFEQAAGELRAKLRIERALRHEARPGFETTRSATHSNTAPPVWRAPEGPEGTGGLRGAGPGCGARGRWRGLAGQRVDAPSEARGADGERAGRRPRAHQAARPHSRIRRRAPGTPAGPQTQTQTQTQQSGPEPLGSGPPSMLSANHHRTTRVSSARPPCRPCRSSRR